MAVPPLSMETNISSPTYTGLEFVLAHGNGAWRLGMRPNHSLSLALSFCTPGAVQCSGSPGGYPHDSPWGGRRGLQVQGRRPGGLQEVQPA